MKHMILSMGLAAAMATGASASIVNNGTFDDTSGWTVDAGSFVSQPGGAGGFPSIDTGSYYWGGNTANSEISQVYMLSAAEAAAASLGQLLFSMSADLFGFSTQADYSYVGFRVLDDAGALLSMFSLESTTNDPGAWGSTFVAGDAPNYQSTSGSIAAGAASLELFVGSNRLAGTSNDGYADNFNVSLSISAIPLPAGGLLLMSALGGLMLRNRRRKS